MDIEILVYDNQLGYYDLLREELRTGYVFTLYPSYTDDSPAKHDAVIFFLNDGIELIDLAKLYDEKLPFILASTKITGDGLLKRENLFNVNLNLTKDALVKEFKKILDGITNQLILSEKAL